MAHFAKIDESNVVLQVHVVNNQDILDSENNESESIVQNYLENNSNWPANLWIKTSYNTQGNQHKLGGVAFRGNYAGIGYTWDATNNIFWPPKPYPSWTKDNTTASWISPAGAEPTLTAEQESQNEAGTNGWIYNWNEENKSWDLVDNLA